MLDFIFKPSAVGTLLFGNLRPLIMDRWAHSDSVCKQLVGRKIIEVFIFLLIYYHSVGIGSLALPSYCWICLDDEVCWNIWQIHQVNLSDVYIWYALDGSLCMVVVTTVTSPFLPFPHFNYWPSFQMSLVCMKNNSQTRELYHPKQTLI